MTGSVTLRAVEPGDVPTFYEDQRDPLGAAMAAFAPRDREAHAAHWAKIVDDPTVHVRTVLRDGHVAGNVVCWLQDERWLVGYWIGREHWGKGVATRALGAFLDEVDERPLYALVAEANVGSIRVLEKCGFQRVGAGPADQADGVVEILFRLPA